MNDKHRNAILRAIDDREQKVDAEAWKHYDLARDAEKGGNVEGADRLDSVARIYFAKADDLRDAREEFVKLCPVLD